MNGKAAAKDEFTGERVEVRWWWTGSGDCNMAFESGVGLEVSSICIWMQ